MQSLISLFFLLFSFVALGDEVDLLLSRKDASNARMELMQNEMKNIRYNTFTFALDDTGKQVLAQMVNAAKRGVKVRLILDGIDPTGLASRNEYLKALKDLGVEIKIFNPKFRHLLSINNRNHIKVLIGSDEVINGGRNTEVNYFKQFIDVEARFNGNEVRAAKLHFDNIWFSDQVKDPIYTALEPDVTRAKADLVGWAENAKTKNIVSKRNPVNVEELRYHSDPPEVKEKKITGIRNDVLRMFTQAESTLEILNPYVLLSEEQQKELENAIKRGVKVKIYTNSSASTDSRLVAMAWESKKQELVQMGAEVYESSRYVHGKTIIRDGKEVFIGSKNLDMRSQNLNLENGIKFKSKRLAEKLSRHQERLGKMFMTKINPADLPTTQAGLCTLKGMRKLISNLAYPHL